MLADAYPAAAAAGAFHVGYILQYLPVPVAELVGLLSGVCQVAEPAGQDQLVHPAVEVGLHVRLV